MILTLYKTLSADNVINKLLVDAHTIVINFKRDTDFINPEIYLAEIAGVDFQDFNYCTITEINRAYFIRNIEAVNNRVYRLYCECDYIETYKADILASACAFRKQVEIGDYGNIETETTGRETIANYKSDVELEPNNTIILSTIGNN